MTKSHDRRQDHRRTRIDWKEARARLARAVAATHDPSVSEARARALLDERARRLARASAEPVDDEGIELLAFVLGSERYAIDSAVVHEVVRFADVTPVPGGPAVVAGVMNHRGQVLALFDLRALAGHPAAAPHADPVTVVVLGTDAPQFGIVADRVEALERVARHEILAAPDMRTGIGADCLRGITAAATVIIDGHRLLADARLVVDQPDA